MEDETLSKITRKCLELDPNKTPIFSIGIKKSFRYVGFDLKGNVNNN